eukprot:1819136-Rhodomonas_salina.1
MQLRNETRDATKLAQLAPHLRFLALDSAVHSAEHQPPGASGFRPAYCPRIARVLPAYCAERVGVA